MCADANLGTRLQQMLTAVAAVTLHVSSKRFARGQDAVRLRGYFDQLVNLCEEANDAISKEVPAASTPSGGAAASDNAVLGVEHHSAGEPVHGAEFGLDSAPRTDGSGEVRSRAGDGRGHNGKHFSSRAGGAGVTLPLGRVPR